MMTKDGDVGKTLILALITATLGASLLYSYQMSTFTVTTTTEADSSVYLLLFLIIGLAIALAIYVRRGGKIIG